MKRIVYLVIVIAVVTAGWRLYAANSRQGVAKAVIPTAAVTRGSLVVTLPGNGTLESAQETPLRSDIVGTLIEISPDNAPGRAFFGRAWDREKCTLCGYCYALCPSGAITRDGEILKCEDNKCVGCCGCFNICPASAWTTPVYKTENFYKGPYAKDLIKEALLKGKEGGK